MTADPTLPDSGLPPEIEPFENDEPNTSPGTADAAGSRAPSEAATAAEDGIQRGRRYRRRGRPSKARGQPNSSDAASARWTVRGVPTPVRDIALRAAEGRNMTVGDWVAEAIVAYARGKAPPPDREAPRSSVPATDSPPDLSSMIQRLDDRLTRIEGWQNRGFLARLFGRA